MCSVLSLHERSFSLNCAPRVCRTRTLRPIGCDSWSFLISRAFFSSFAPIQLRLLQLLAALEIENTANIPFERINTTVRTSTAHKLPTVRLVCIGRYAVWFSLGNIRSVTMKLQMQTRRFVFLLCFLRMPNDDRFVFWAWRMAVGMHSHIPIVTSVISRLIAIITRRSSDYFTNARNQRERERE